MAVPRALDPFVAAADRAVLFVDYDGSLSPIVRDPAAAKVLPAARTALARLVPLVGRVVVVSGRPAGFLLDALALDAVDYVGAYGLERVVDGEVVVDERVAPHAEAVRARWRCGGGRTARSPGRAQGRGGVDHPLARDNRPAPPRPRTGPQRLRRGSGSMRPCAAGWRWNCARRSPSKGHGRDGAGAWCRGRCVRGDDAGDLPAFAALRVLAESGEVDHAITIGVASDEGPREIRAADVVVDGPPGLARLFDDLADALSGRG